MALHIPKQSTEQSRVQSQNSVEPKIQATAKEISDNSDRIKDFTSSRKEVVKSISRWKLVATLWVFKYSQLFI